MLTNSIPFSVCTRFHKTSILHPAASKFLGSCTSYMYLSILINWHVKWHKVSFENDLNLATKFIVILQREVGKWRLLKNVSLEHWFAAKMYRIYGKKYSVHLSRYEKSIAYKQIFRNFPTLCAIMRFFGIMWIMRSELNYAILHWHIIPEALLYVEVPQYTCIPNKHTHFKTKYCPNRWGTWMPRYKHSVNYKGVGKSSTVHVL